MKDNFVTVHVPDPGKIQTMDQKEYKMNEHYHKHWVKYVLGFLISIFLCVGCGLFGLVAIDIARDVASAQTIQDSNPVAENPAPANSASSWEVSGYNGAVCPKPDGMVDVISPENDYRTMVRMGDGRLFQPCLPEEEIRPSFESSFTGYCLGEASTCEMVVHTINSELWYDSDKDGTPDQKLAAYVGSKVVTIHNGGWYKIVAGESNGGLDLVPFSD